MREVQFTACAPCALHLLKISLTKTANLETQRGKSSQKHPGDMPKARKASARRPVDSLYKSILDAVLYNQEEILQLAPNSQVL